MIVKIATSPDLQWVESGDDFLRICLDTRIYDQESIFRTCYLFTDKCYLFLRPGSDSEVIVEFRAKASVGDLRTIIGDFGNELINQKLRAQLARQTKTIRELIVAQAFAEADLDGK